MGLRANAGKQKTDQNSHQNSAQQIYDVIVVGSGATGGVAAKELSEQGLSVLVLEAGRSIEPKNLANGAIAMAKRLYNLGARRQSSQSLHPGYWKANPDLFVDEVDNPYTTPDNKPFSWTRGRQVGGKSLTWGGITLRLSDYELKAASRDGYGQDWPIDYSDLAPYYDHLEQFLGVQGACDNLPQLPNGDYQSPASFTPAEKKFKAAIDAVIAECETSADQSLLHIPHMIISRGFALHHSTRDRPWPKSSSLGSSLNAALATGRVTVQPNSVVSHLTFDPETCLATGVQYIDRITHQSRILKSRVVMLCASAIESVRILLHSTAIYQPGGLANQSGQLGHYLMDHISTSRFFVMPGLESPKKTPELSGSGSFMIPRFCNLGTQNQPFLRGYGLWGGVQRLSVPPVLQRVKGAIGFLIGHGEVLPQYHNHVRLNPNIVDAWGIPVAHIDCEWSTNEHKMVKHMHQSMEMLIKQAGGKCLGLTELFYMPLISQYIQKMQDVMAFAAPPGYYIHEVGGACMGTSPRTSVLNAHNQCWDAPNVLVTDGACWTSSGWQSPTLTSMALTARASDFIVKRFRSGALLERKTWELF